MASVLVKMLVSGKNYTKSVWVKNSLAGFLAGIICYYSLHSAPINGMLKSIIMCTCGAFTPQALDFIRQKYENKNKKEKAKVQGPLYRRRARGKTSKRLT
jgi:hypothetical protein